MIMHRCSFRSLVLVLLFTFFLSGCGDDSTGPDQTSSSSGSFEVSYSGDASGTISGGASFGEVEDPPQSFPTSGTFAVAGYETDDQQDGFILMTASSRPEPGTYEVVSAIEREGPFIAIVHELTKNLTTKSVSGTVTIEESSADRVEGTFDATLGGSMSGGGVLISATGSFTAVPCEEGDVSCDQLR